MSVNKCEQSQSDFCFVSQQEVVFPVNSVSLNQDDKQLADNSVI